MLRLHRFASTAVARLAPILALAGGVAIAGCGNLPVSAFVPQEVVRGLSQGQYVEDLDHAAVARAVEEATGYGAGPRRVGPALFRRLDRVVPGGPWNAQRFAERRGADAERLAGVAAGDLILAKNPKPQSFGSSLALDPFGYYDHVALLSFEDERAFVYESWPRLVLFGSAPKFAGRFRGHVRRVPFAAFLARYETLVFLRWPEIESQRLVDAARHAARDRIPYDPYHDPENPALSCSEFLVYLLEQAGAASLPQAWSTTRNSSVRAVIEALGFAAPAIYAPDGFAHMPGVKCVAVISRLANLGELRAREAAFELLYDRLAPQSGPQAGAAQVERMGSYLAFDRWRLSRYRRNVELFLNWAGGYGARCEPVSREAARQVLERMAPIFFVRRANSSGS